MIADQEKIGTSGKTKTFETQRKGGSGGANVGEESALVAK
jgi:hypothetical protein